MKVNFFLFLGSVKAHTTLLIHHIISVVSGWKMVDENIINFAISKRRRNGGGEIYLLKEIKKKIKKKPVGGLELEKVQPNITGSCAPGFFSISLIFQPILLLHTTLLYGVTWGIFFWKYSTKKKRWTPSCSICPELEASSIAPSTISFQKTFSLRRASVRMKRVVR